MRTIPLLVMATLLAAAEASAEGAASADPAAPAGELGTDYVIEDGKVVARTGEQKTVLGFPGTAFALQHQGTELYVARGPAGVALYDVSDPLRPVLVEQFAVRGNATGFTVVEGQLWVLVTERSAVPLHGGAMEAQVTPTEPRPTPTPEPAEGEPQPAPATQAAIALLAVGPGHVEIARGAGGGVRVGDRFALFRQQEVQEEGFVGEELVALAEVTRVKRDSAFAELSRNTVVRASDVARPARKDQIESNVYPVRIPHVGEFGAVLRPIVNAGSPLGLGVLAEAHASYWGSAYFFDIVLQPVGLGWSEDGNVVSTAGLLQAGYDNRAFAVGLGGGISWVNGNADEMLGSSGFAESDAGSPNQTVERQVTHSAFTLSQQARLGARDGLNLSLRNTLILHRDEEQDESGFIYGGTLGKLTLPLDRRSDLFLEGGGGVMGYWLVGAGVGTWVVGNGAPGSWKLSISAGVAGIWGSREVTETVMSPPDQPRVYTYDEDIGIGGPMVSVGFQRRFALD